MHSRMILAVGKDHRIREDRSRVDIAKVRHLRRIKPVKVRVSVPRLNLSVLAGRH
jgi:hypothetical protein